MLLQQEHFSCGTEGAPVLGSGFQLVNVNAAAHRLTVIIGAIPPNLMLTGTLLVAGNQRADGLAQRVENAQADPGRLS